MPQSYQDQFSAASFKLINELTVDVEGYYEDQYHVDPAVQQSKAQGNHGTTGGSRYSSGGRLGNFNHGRFQPGRGYNRIGFCGYNGPGRSYNQSFGNYGAGCYDSGGFGHSEYQQSNNNGVYGQQRRPSYVGSGANMARGHGNLGYQGCRGYPQGRQSPGNRSNGPFYAPRRAESHFTEGPNSGQEQYFQESAALSYGNNRTTRKSNARSSQGEAYYQDQEFEEEDPGSQVQDWSEYEDQFYQDYDNLDGIENDLEDGTYDQYDMYHVDIEQAYE
jgi:hypothetical protein